MSGIRMPGTEVAIPKIRSHNSGGRLGRITVRFSLAVILMAILHKFCVGTWVQDGSILNCTRKDWFCALPRCV